jgi:succinate dehydrogenase / fumarate reductase, cytochrome b subunit
MALWIAASGLSLILFLLVHLLGVGLQLFDPAGFERYAIQLHHSSWFGAAEGLLLITALTHLMLALHRARVNARARGPLASSMVRSQREAPLAALASRSAPISGSLLLLFLIVHLVQVRLHRPPDGLEAAALRQVLASPWVLALYTLAAGPLALHLLQGTESAHRSLGLLDAANGGRIRAAGRVLAILLGSGFALLPLALVLQGAASARAALVGGL